MFLLIFLLLILLKIRLDDNGWISPGDPISLARNLFRFDAERSTRMDDDKENGVSKMILFVRNLSVREREREASPPSPRTA